MWLQRLFPLVKDSEDGILDCSTCSATSCGSFSCRSYDCGAPFHDLGDYACYTIPEEEEESKRLKKTERRATTSCESAFDPFGFEDACPDGMNPDWFMLQDMCEGSFYDSARHGGSEELKAAGDLVDQLQGEGLVEEIVKEMQKRGLVGPLVKNEGWTSWRKGNSLKALPPPPPFPPPSSRVARFSSVDKKKLMRELRTVVNPTTSGDLAAGETRETVSTSTKEHTAVLSSVEESDAATSKRLSAFKLLLCCRHRPCKELAKEKNDSNPVPWQLKEDDREVYSLLTFDDPRDPDKALLQALAERRIFDSDWWENTSWANGMDIGTGEAPVVTVTSPGLYQRSTSKQDSLSQGSVLIKGLVGKRQPNAGLGIPKVVADAFDSTDIPSLTSSHDSSSLDDWSLLSEQESLESGTASKQRSCVPFQIRVWQGGNEEIKTDERFSLPKEVVGAFEKPSLAQQRTYLEESSRNCSSMTYDSIPWDEKSINFKATTKKGLPSMIVAPLEVATSHTISRPTNLKVDQAHGRHLRASRMKNFVSVHYPIQSIDEDACLGNTASNPSSKYYETTTCLNRSDLLALEAGRRLYLNKASAGIIKPDPSGRKPDPDGAKYDGDPHSGRFRRRSSNTDS
jgi:hypothetical protein